MRVGNTVPARAWPEQRPATKSQFGFGEQPDPRERVRREDSTWLDVSSCRSIPSMQEGRLRRARRGGPARILARLAFAQTASSRSTSARWLTTARVFAAIFWPSEMIACTGGPSTSHCGSTCTRRPAFTWPLATRSWI